MLKWGDWAHVEWSIYPATIMICMEHVVSCTHQSTRFGDSRLWRMFLGGGSFDKFRVSGKLDWTSRQRRMRRRVRLSDALQRSVFWLSPPLSHVDDPQQSSTILDYIHPPSLIETTTTKNQSTFTASLSGRMGHGQRPSKLVLLLLLSLLIAAHII